MLSKSQIHEKILFAGLSISVMALPFSIIICHVGIFIVLLNWIVQGHWRKNFSVLMQTPIALVFIVFFCWHLGGLIYSEDIVNGWFNIEKKFTFAILPLVLATSVVSEKSKNLLLSAFVLCCFAGTLYCLGSSFYRMIYQVENDQINFGITQPELLLANPLFTNHWQQLSYIALASAINIHPTYLSVYIIFCLFVLIIGYQRDFIDRKLSIGLIIYFTAFLALLSTRITLMVVLISSLLGLVYFLYKTSLDNFKKLAMGTILIALFLFLSALNPISLYRDFQEIKHSTYEITPNTLHTNSTTVRLSLWWTGFLTATQVNSVVGAGTGDVQHEIQRIAQLYGIKNVLNSSDPHNQYLYTFISLGAIGLLLLIGCYLLPVRRAINSRDQLHILFIGLISTVSFTESFLESQKGIVFFILFQSLLSFADGREQVRNKLIVA